jgi:hypothetical protein
MWSPLLVENMQASMDGFGMRTRILPSLNKSSLQQVLVKWEPESRNLLWSNVIVIPQIEWKLPSRCTQTLKLC